MPSKLNVLVYNGSGVSQSSRDYAVRNLRAFLGHSYDVQLVSPKSLRQDPWTETCALLVFPGGRDLPYLHDLNGSANDRIRQWVSSGGQYLGLCAGAYYASRRVEFEVGTPLEVFGDRPFQFFPGVCRGTTFPGFAYETEAGARECVIRLDRGAWRNHWNASPDQLAVWYNGGGSFVADEQVFSSGNVQILARYDEAPGQPIAGVRCQVDRGQAILWAVHPEHPTFSETSPRAQSLLHQDFATKEVNRQNLLRATLLMFDLDVSDAPSAPPQLSPLFLCSNDLSLVVKTAQNLSSTSASTVRDGTVDIKDRHDTFCLHQYESASVLVSEARNAPGEVEVDKLHAATKHIVVCSDQLPFETLTPLFNHAQYFGSLASREMGRVLLYGEAVTSTQTMLDKNDRFLSALPTGLTCIASHQIAGRGRGGNSWVSPAGCLQFSLVVRLPAAESRKIVFVQYLFGLAVVEAVRNVPGYENVGIRLKWPNDIYAEVQDDDDKAVDANPMDRFKKIGGILVNSSYANDEFVLVVGCGINTSNPRPTTSVNEIVQRHNRLCGTRLALFTQEQLMALIMNQFETMWTTFRSASSFEPFVDLYLSRWIHTDQRVTIDATKQQVKIVGITPDHGLLRTVPVETDSSGREIFTPANGQRQQYVDLQPDGNGFDMLKSLLVSR